MQRAAVIGGGPMGHGIAQVLALGGLDVVVHDPAAEALWVFEAAPEDQATAVRERVLARLAAANQAENGVTA